MSFSKSIPKTFMQRCIDLARLGASNVAPNPMVGCVIVHNDVIIGEGYHQVYGGPHAEVNAIQNVKDKTLLSQSTLYVNLEPCNHHGKTPPCSLLILEYKIPHVVIGCVDSFSEVAGKGIENLRKNGVNVEVGLLEKECLWLNRRFFTFHNKKRPYIILKWAQTANGFMDIDRSQNKQLGIQWITQPETQQLTHKWRSEEAGILVGKNTALNDNPSLTCRAIEGVNPTRIVIDKKLELKRTLNLFNSGEKVVVFNEIKTETSDNIQYVKLNFGNNILPQLLDHLYELNLLSVIIEGGKNTIEQFIQTNLWDEARVLKGESTFSQGVIAPQLHNNITQQFYFGKDFITIYSND